MAESTIVLTEKKYLAEAKMRHHFAIIDEPGFYGGDDNGPSPVEYLLTAIGGCVSITLRIYAERKGWDVGKITVNVSQIKDENKTYLKEEISFEKEITENQKKRLLAMAAKCPVAKMVKGETEIVSSIQ